jgi:hypothetical protein
MPVHYLDACSFPFTEYELQSSHPTECSNMSHQNRLMPVFISFSTALIFIVGFTLGFIMLYQLRYAGKGGKEKLSDPFLKILFAHLPVKAEEIHKICQNI